jgi:hypothetical protein
MDANFFFLQISDGSIVKIKTNSKNTQILVYNQLLLFNFISTLSNPWWVN